MKVCDENDDENPFTKVPYCSDSDGEEACYTNLLYANGNEDNDIDVKSLQQFINFFLSRENFYIILVLKLENNTFD